MIEKETLRQEQREELRKAYAAQGTLFHPVFLTFFFFLQNKSSPCPIKRLYCIIQSYKSD